MNKLFDKKIVIAVYSLILMVFVFSPANGEELSNVEAILTVNNR